MPEPMEFVVRNELFAPIQSPQDLESRALHLNRLARRSPAEADGIFRQMIAVGAQLQSGLKTAEEKMKGLDELLKKLAEPPMHPGTFLERIERPEGSCARVIHGGSQRVVTFGPEVDPDSLEPGDEVFLSNELNTILNRSTLGPWPCGETATFEQRTARGERAIIRWRDEQLIVEMAKALRDAPPEKGDLVRWDRKAWMAFEKLERPRDTQFLLDDVPDVDRSAVGGQNANLDALLSALLSALVAPKKAAEYGIDTRQSILMVGPPGCGKTLMARVAAAEIGRASGKDCRFGVIKPSEWESPWVGETQRKIREVFAAAREAAREACVVLFFDEIEAVGRHRGGAVGHHSDKFLSAFLAELNGFEDRSQVAVIAATNRKDLIDPALLERISDLEIAVGRPDLEGARAIFGIHLPEHILFASNGAGPAETREEVIEAAVSALYSPNGRNQLCQLRFRDGTTRTVTARDLASGRTFEQICRMARRSAFLRDLQGGRSGISRPDIEEAVAATLERLATTLTPRNAHVYLSDLPQDVDCVSVEPIRTRVNRAYKYLNVA